MGKLSSAIFGRELLPEKVLIYAGSYVPERKEWVRSLFDDWGRIRGHWIKYSLACKNDSEYLLIFNVYGASMILEMIQLLKDGNVRKVFFVGAVGGKDLPVGTLVLPTEIVDKTGIVTMDDASRSILRPDEVFLRKLKGVLDNSDGDYVQGRIVSVPCVLHNIGHIKEFVERNDVLGVEMEVSTFIHYSGKEGLESYALLYVSDNRKHDIISKARSVKEARRRSLRRMTRIAFEALK